MSIVPESAPIRHILGRQLSGLGFEEPRISTALHVLFGPEPKTTAIDLAEMRRYLDEVEALAEFPDADPNPEVIDEQFERWLDEIEEEANLERRIAEEVEQRIADQEQRDTIEGQPIENAA